MPTVHLELPRRRRVKAYAAHRRRHGVDLAAADTDPVAAPAMAGFSSFGPALAGGGDLLKPDITAPGVDVIAAVAPPGNAATTSTPIAARRCPRRTSRASRR